MSWFQGSQATEGPIGLSGICTNAYGNKIIFEELNADWV